MKLPTGKRPGGRPRKHKIEPGDRVALNVRVTPELKEWIDKASEVSGRSQSQEVEIRLTRAKDREGLLGDALTLRHGWMTAGVMMVLSNALRVVEQLAAHTTITEGGKLPLDEWMDDPRAYEAAVRAITSTLAALHPSNTNVSVPSPSKGRPEPGQWDQVGDYAARVAAMSALVTYGQVLPGKQRRKAAGAAKASKRGAAQ